MSIPTQPFDPDESFDEDWYIRNYADIASGVASGKHRSGWQHYSEHGRAEGRQPYDPRLLGLVEQASEELEGRLFVVDEFVLAGGAAGGAALLRGWFDDRSDPLASLRLQPYFGPAIDLLPRLARYRRDDIAGMFEVSRDAHDYGFWIALDGLAPGLPPVGARLAIGFASGRATELHLESRLVGAAELRDRVLRAAGWQRNAPPDPRATGLLAGPVVRSLHRAVLARSTSAAPLRFSRAQAEPALSVIISLQTEEDEDAALRNAAFFAAARELARAEFIYVRGGPGAGENFEAMVQAVHELYGLDAVALRCFGAPGPVRARNEGAAAARGGALLILSGATIPAGPDWLDQVLAAAQEKTVTGACLLDEDDAVASCGLRWQRLDHREAEWAAVPRLAGFPAVAMPTGPVAVDAVPEQAMLLPHELFATLGGFSEDFVSGSEALDLCLRARQAGAAIRAQAGLRFHHLPAGEPHEGEPGRAAAILDRAYFNELWGAELGDDQPGNAA